MPYEIMLGKFNSDAWVTQTLLEKPHRQTLGFGMPFSFFFLNLMTDFTSCKGIKGYPYFNARSSIWYNKRWNKASMHSRTSWWSSRYVNHSVLCCHDGTGP